MIVYRFFPEEYALATLESGLLKVGRFLDFNDPFEFYPQNPLLKEVNGIVWEFNLDSFVNRSVSSRFGIICFSAEETINKPLLWSHYADGHRGIALGFEIDETSEGGKFLVADRDSDRGYVPLHEVNYDGFNQIRNSRVSADSLTELSTNFEKREESDILKVIRNTLPSLTTHKGEDWRYEAELRATIPLSSAIFKGGRHFLPSDCFSVSEIVIGFRSKLDPIYFVDFAKRYGAKVFTVERHATDFMLVKKEENAIQPPIRIWEQQPDYRRRDGGSSAFSNGRKASRRITRPVHVRNDSRREGSEGNC